MADWETVPDSEWETVPQDKQAVSMPANGQTISAPTSLDAKELDYSAKTQLDGKPVQDFWGMVHVGEDFAKGLGHFAMSLPGTAGQLVKSAGETMGQEEKPYEKFLPPMLHDPVAADAFR